MMQVDYEAVLTDLEQRRAELDEGIKALERMVSRFFGASVETVPLMTNASSSVLRFLSARQGVSFSANEISGALGTFSIGTVRGALWRLSGKRAIQRMKRGKFARTEPRP